MESVKAVKSVSKESSIERHILLGMINSKEFLQKIHKFYNPDYFVSPNHAIISFWIISYFEDHSDAPKNNIYQLYQLEKESFDDRAQKEIESILSRLSEEAEINPDFNVDYLLNKTKNYFEKRELILTSIKLEELANKGDIDKAKEIRYDASKSINIDSGSFRSVLSQDTVKAVLHRQQQAKVFRFPGALNKVVKPWSLGNFIALQAPGKRGKSWWLVYIAYLSLVQGLPFVYFSFEMPKEEVEARIIQCACSLIDYSDTETQDKELFPVFDCLKNQIGSCKNPNRSCKVTLRPEDSDELPLFSRAPKGYKPCTYCRGVDDMYSAATWFEEFKRPDFTKEAEVLKEVKNVQKILRTSGTVEFYPRGSFSIRDIETRLNILEYEHNFIPQIIIVDYLDISKKSGGEFRHDINAIWEYSDGLAKSRNAIFVTGTQGGKASYNKESQSEEDNTEDYRKIANVDQLLAINQIPKEKNRKLWRVATIAKRSGNFNPFMQALCLHNLSAGQVCLDSEIVFRGID